MKKQILIRFGDLVLKGKNIGFFIRAIRTHVKHQLENMDVEFHHTHDRIYIKFNEIDQKEIISRLKKIPGLYSFSLVYETTNDLDDIVKTAVIAAKEQLKNEKTIKIETKRADKSYPLTSLEISKKIAGPILSQIDQDIKVDVRHPEVTINIEIRRDVTFVYIGQIFGMGGFPYGTAGKGLLMMSGGLDSPVAAYLAMKQGIQVELFHFESTPLTPLESVQKVIDLAKVLSVYTVDQSIKLHLVPFTHIHEDLLKHVTDSYSITIMRRMMYRLGETYANRHDIKCLINGESVGQVASQTLSSMQVVENVTNLPIIRPVVTYDKSDIIKLAYQLDTFDISTRPFNDCCSIYVPRKPVTKPTIAFSEKEEKKLDFSLIEEALDHIITLHVTPDLNFQIAEYGFSVQESYESWMKEEEKHDCIETK